MTETTAFLPWLYCMKTILILYGDLEFICSVRQTELKSPKQTHYHHSALLFVPFNIFSYHISTSHTRNTLSGDIFFRNMSLTVHPEITMRTVTGSIIRFIVSSIPSAYLGILNEL